MKINIFFLKIIGAMVTSFLLSGFIIAVVFPTKSPRLRPNLQSYLTDKILKNIPKFSSKNVTQSTPKSPIKLKDSETGLISAREALKKIPYNTVSKGIYSKSDTNFSYTLIKEKEIEWKKTQGSINGQNVTVLVPSGEQSPI